MELRHLTSLNRQLSFSELTNTLINCSVRVPSPSQTGRSALTPPLDRWPSPSPEVTGCRWMKASA